MYKLLLKLHILTGEKYYIYDTSDFIRYYMLCFCSQRRILENMIEYKIMTQKDKNTHKYSFSSYLFVYAWSNFTYKGGAI